MRACEPEPRAASLCLRASKDSRQKVQKRAKCPKVAFITCGVLHICEYPRNFLSNRTKGNRTLTILIPFPNFLHKRSRAVIRFVKNGKANFGSLIEGNPKYSGQKKPKWILHLTSTEISGIFHINENTSDLYVLVHCSISK